MDVDVSHPMRETLMRAAVCERHGQPLKLREVPIPTPGPGQVLLRVSKCGVCHTDVHACAGDWAGVPSKLPLIPGHEAVGRVVARGPLGAEGAAAGEAAADELRPGTRVGVPWLFSACGLCEYCETGWETLCPRQKNTGFSVDGGFEEYMLAEASHVTPIPEGLSAEAAAPLLCAGLTAYKGLKETECRAGEYVAIVGAAGGLGHLAIQYARAMGLRPIAVDTTTEKLTSCAKMGATVTCLSGPGDSAASAVRAATPGGLGAHGALVLAPACAAFTEAVCMLRPRGVLVCIALPAGTFEVPIVDVVLKRLTIRGSIVGTRQDLRETLAFAAAGAIRCATQLRPFEQAEAALEAVKRGEVVGRLVLDLDPEDRS